MRNELITKINDLFDENTNLKTRNEFLEVIIKTSNEKNIKEVTSEKENSKLSDLDKKLVEYAKSELYEKTVRRPSVSVDGLSTKENVKFQKFENWVNGAIYSYSLPDCFSKDDIKNIFYDELMEMYSEEKAKAINDYEKSKESKEE